MRTTKQEELSEPLPPLEAQRSRRRHVLDLDDFTREEIELVFETADAMKEVFQREIKKVPTLRGKTLVTMFYEASTRTRISFEQAAKSLSADVINISASGSSTEKGESLIDTVRTIQALGADVIVMRHYHAGAPYLIAQHVDVTVINGGDGCHAHPTQGLLDLYTMREHLGTVEGAKVVIVGDILHSRVARSNIWGLTKMGVEVVLCAPPTLIPVGLGPPAFPLVTMEPSLDRAVEGADVVMPLRLQKERQQRGLLPSIREYIQFYQLDLRRLSMAKPNALVLHPGPMNEGVEITAEVAHGAQSVIEEQVTNGVAVRMAILYLLMGGAQ
ncbi:MAG: aspartate carbamoyltransferase catalytic subunit [Dehalococcoidia bacterium]|jgi:aspartate carbamoyltransferase catalytic subunit|nr:aspartate carbamoyltransferase catalytic subunit [Chloroflexota bacterium]MCK4242994.1 aspartate carbamoyltransferase catalytic subunit [Dehalococcoidia bacterium]